MFGLLQSRPWQWVNLPQKSEVRIRKTLGNIGWPINNFLIGEVIVSIGDFWGPLLDVLQWNAMILLMEEILHHLG